MLFSVFLEPEKPNYLSKTTKKRKTIFLFMAIMIICQVTKNYFITEKTDSTASFLTRLAQIVSLENYNKIVSIEQRFIQKHLIMKVR